MIKIFLTFLLIIFSVAGSGAQQKYWIYLKDKTAEANTSSSPKDFYDLPINDTYKARLDHLGFDIIQQSRWLNAVSVLLHEPDLQKLSKLSFIEKIVPVNHNLKVLSYRQHSSKMDLAPALRQVRADTLIQAGFTGDGVKIGIIDAGFLNADKEEALSPLIRNGNFKAYRNFIEQDLQDPFSRTKRYADDHGTVVWKTIGGYDKENNSYTGIAHAATYYLARTDQGDKEYRGEEDYWIAAMEWMYDQGVRLINSSLGYSDGYDQPQENYSPQQVDGTSSAITQAATIAVQEKGMFLVVSAGNDGNNAFELISLPADAKGVIAVGATAYNRWSKQLYSSIGPAGLSYIKPDVACYSARGTSFSAPVITGVIAGLLQAYPGATNAAVAMALKKSSHLYPYPNNFLGYGVPDVRKALKLLANPHDAVAEEREVIETSLDHVTLKLSATNVVLFHKKNETQVIEQEKVKPKRGVLDIHRKENAKFTTVATPEAVYEVVWLGL